MINEHECTWNRYCFRTFEKKLLQISKIVLTYSNSLARHFSPLFHAKCLLPGLNKLLPVRSWLKYFYQWAKIKIQALSCIKIIICIGIIWKKMTTLGFATIAEAISSSYWNSCRTLMPSAYFNNVCHWIEDDRGHWGGRGQKTGKKWWRPLWTAPYVTRMH